MIFKSSSPFLILLVLATVSGCYAGAEEPALSSDSVEEYLENIENPASLSRLARSPAQEGVKWSSDAGKILIYASVFDFTAVAASQSILGGVGLLSYVRKKCSRTPPEKIEFEARSTLTSYLEIETANNIIYVPYMLIDRAQVDAYATIACDLK